MSSLGVFSEISLLTGTGNFEMRAGNYFGGAANLLEQQGRR
jgi:hypothetical protein